MHGRCRLWRCAFIDVVPSAIAHLPDVELVACAARSLSDATEFAQKFHIPSAYGSYAELVADARIEVIYIGTLHPQHAEHAIFALNGGKHVLVEKPFAVNHAEAVSIVEAARASGKFLMEAMWTRFLPSIAKVRSLIASGVIGVPKLVEASFGFHMASPSEVPRLWENKHGGGACLDLAVYPIALANMVFGQGGKKQPTKIVAVGDLSEGEKVDTHEAITLQSVRATRTWACGSSCS
jgi:dihydrodiol dehydrogenase / D-xylose 1-dehydrogenase (NADP)